MDSKVVELLNDQVNKEFYSAYLYLEFANYYDSIGLDGFENWYRVQAQEERDHAMLILRYMQMNGMKVTLDAIEKPSVELTSNLGVLEAGYSHEQYVTGLINTIYAAAHEKLSMSRMTFSHQMIRLIFVEQLYRAMTILNGTPYHHE